ncbi:MAG TPA: glycosyltransferase [Chloroflexota bacterium]
MSSIPSPDPGVTEARAARLSVVVASHSSATQVRRCLDSLLAQRRDGVSEIILVTAGSDDVASSVRRLYPAIQVVQRSCQALTPEMWGEGVRRGHEAIIALTTAEMLPEPGWARALLDRFEREPWAAVGGVIVPSVDLGPVDAAIFWLRYHRFASIPRAGAVRDIAGDNGSYRLEALQPHLERITRDGFWENELNQDLVASGNRLCLEPRAVVRYRGGESFGLFARQRLAHGRRFGIERFDRRHGARRWFLLAAWPLTPAALLMRVLRGAVAARALPGLLPGLPVLLALIGCWSAGELLGYLAAARHGAGRLPLADPSVGAA